MTTNRISGATLSLFSVWVIWESRKLPLGTFHNPGPAFMPVLLASLLLVFGILITVTGGSAERFHTLQWKELPHAAVIVVACICSALALERLGYRITIFLILFVLVKFVEKRAWLGATLFALALSFGSFYLFYTLLRVPLPLGPWGI
jgi:putative tricarboxylic transport membrane protein